MPIIVITGRNAAELASKVSDVLDTDVQPIGNIFIVDNSGLGRQLCQLMGESDSAITAYSVVQADSLGELGSKLDTALATADSHLLGGIQIVGDNVNLREFVQAVVVGDMGGGSGGGSVTLPATGTAAELTAGTVTDNRLWSPKVLQDAIPELPTTGTAAELQAGTVTQNRLWSPKAIHDEVARQIAAIPPSA